MAHRDRCPKRFPSGIESARRLCTREGLKFGIYSDAGTRLVRPSGQPGIRVSGRAAVRGLGVDYLKFDWCSTSTQDARSSYELMRAALDASGRPIVFSICEWGSK